VPELPVNFVVHQRAGILITKKLHALLSLSLMALGMVLLSCSKSDEEPGGNGTPTELSGKLLYTFVGTVSQLDLATNVEGVYFTYNTYGFNDWSMSMDC